MQRQPKSQTQPVRLRSTASAAGRKAWDASSSGPTPPAPKRDEPDWGSPPRTRHTTAELQVKTWIRSWIENSSW